MATHFPILLVLLFANNANADTSITSASMSSVVSEGPSAPKPLLDQAMRDAGYEAALVLSVFALGSLLIHLFGMCKCDSIPLALRIGLGQDTTQKQSEVHDKCQRRAVQGKPVGNASSAHSSATLEGLAQAVRSGRAAQLPWYLDRLHAQAIASCSDPSHEEELTTRHLLAALRACASARCFKEGLLAYQHVASRIDTGQGTLWSLLLYCAVESARCGLAADFFRKLCIHGQPSSHDFVNMVRCYVHQQDFLGLQGMLADLRLQGCSIDNFATNKALAACSWAPLEFAEAVVHGVKLDTIGYNTLMKLHAKAGNLSHILHLRAEMVDSGVGASEVTFGVLLDACVGAGDYDRARSVFAELRSSGVRPNVVHCTTLIKGLIAADRLGEADDVLDEMLDMCGTQPDIITYSTLIKAHSNQGNLVAARGVLEKMILQGVKPDDIILNSVLSSCCGGSAEPAVTLRTFEALVARGLQPSTMTLSILLKALLFSGAWELALNTLKRALMRFDVESETRLYVQIVQACLKAHESTVAVQAYEAMLEVVSEEDGSSICSRLVRQCTLSGDHHTSMKMQKASRFAGINIDSR